MGLPLPSRSKPTPTAAAFLTCKRDEDTRSSDRPPAGIHHPDATTSTCLRLVGAIVPAPPPQIGDEITPAGISPTSALKMYNARRRSAQYDKGGQQMKRLMTAGLSLCAVLAALGEAEAYVNYPWCIIGNTRGIDCVFSSREQCAEDGRNRGFGGQCIKNPNYDPDKGPVVNSGIMLNSLGQPLHNPAEAPLMRGTQRKKQNQGRQK